jgi:hypothetical protein
VNCPARVAGQETEPGGALPQVHQQVPGLLHGPRPAVAGRGELAARAADPLAWRQTLARLDRQSLARVDRGGYTLP